jgi:hypothetical protein
VSEYTIRDGQLVTTIHSNVFRMTWNRSLDRVYLRTCAIYRLLKIGRIDKAGALELARRRIKGCHVAANRLDGTIELWLAGPLAYRKGRDA